MTTIQLFVGLAIILYYLVIFSLIRKKILMIKYALIWICFGVLLLAFDLFPDSLYVLSGIMGISLPSNALFLIMIFLLVIISIVMTGIVSSLAEKNRLMTQQIALLTDRVHKLEQNDKHRHEI